MPRRGNKSKKVEKKSAGNFSRAAASSKSESAATQAARQRVADFYAKQDAEGANLHPNWRSAIEVNYKAAQEQRKKDAEEESAARLKAYHDRKARHEETMARLKRAVQTNGGHDDPRWRGSYDDFDATEQTEVVHSDHDENDGDRQHDDVSTSSSGSEPYPSVASPGKPRRPSNKESKASGATWTVSGYHQSYDPLKRKVRKNAPSVFFPKQFTCFPGEYYDDAVDRVAFDLRCTREEAMKYLAPRERAPFQEAFNSKNAKASAASAVATSDQPLRLAQKKQEPKVPPKYRVVAMEAADRKYNLTSSSPQFRVIGYLGEYFEDVVDEVAYENRCTREEAVKLLDAAERAHFQKKDNNKHAAEIK
jgi:hypothetical protein